MRRLLFGILFFSCSFLLKAQYFQTGQDPASIRWQQINTENFQLIYPEYFEYQAQKLAHVLEKVYHYGSSSLNYHPKKISVILHTQTVKSNGLVAWAPKRSEFYTTPHQAIYPQDWLEQLALHEFRHVVQIDKMNSEIPKLIKLILGEQGTALIFGAYLPWWFIEGDAVVTETALSNYGRGRLPSFLMEHHAQLVEKGKFSYDKAYNRSFKDHVPGHYQLGYFLVGEARARYGSGIWDSVITRVGKKPFSLTPFNTALKRTTGFNKVGLYHSIFDSLQTVWRENDKKYQSIAFQIKSTQNKRYTNYTHNHLLNDSTLVSYKTSFNEIPSFVSINKSGKESKLFFPGTIFDESINYRGEWIVWSEHIPDARWSHSGKSLIRIRDISLRKLIEIKPEYKCFSPSISPDKTQVAVVETDFSNNFYLSVYSVPDGQLLKRVQTGDNYYLFTPEWLDENNLALIVLTTKGKRLSKVNLVTGETEVLLDREAGDIKHLKFAANQLYFISSYSGKDGLYVFNFESGEVRLVYEPRFGAGYPAISDDGKKIVLSDYTSGGFRLIQVRGNSEDLPSIGEVQQADYLLAEILSAQEPGVPDFTSLDSAHYQSKKFSKPANLFNFHSWAPLSVDVGSYGFSPGVSLMSQNKLGTAETILGYEWDYTEKTGKYYASYIYKGWYPVFSFDVSTGERASEYLLIQQTKNQLGQIIRQDTTIERYTWNQTNAEMDVRIPFVLTKGAFYRLLQPEIRYAFTNFNQAPSNPEQLFDGNFQSVSYRMYYHQLLNQSFQDVYPNLGIVIDGNYQHSPWGNIDLGSLAFLQSNIYLPGLMANHGIKIYSGIQEKKLSGKFGFTDVIRYPRGWGKLNTAQMYSLAVDYKFPLFYPDWSLGGLLYLQRVSASLFCDFAGLKVHQFDKEGNVVNTYPKNISSTGIELWGDMNFLRFYAPVTVGLRTSYLPETKNVYYNFLFSIDFNSL
jgi:hypothetical protein